MSQRHRLIIAIVIGLLSTLMSFVLLHWRGYGDGDFTWPLGGASALLHHIDPYTNPAFGPGKPYPYGDLLFYPMPALIIALPFTVFPPYFAGALFFGIGSAVLGYAVTRDGYDRLPIFLSAPFFVAAYVAQWSPLIVAAAFLPWLMPLAFAKPNLGLAIGVAYPRRRAIIITAVVYALSLLIMPRWPLEWLKNLRGIHHPMPILIIPGFLLLLAVVAWRRSAGRLLLVMALVPQLTFFYDQLPLWLIPRTWRQSLALSVCSWVAYGGWAYSNLHNPSMMDQIALAVPWMIGCIYMPALAVLLWQQRQINAEARVGNKAEPAIAGAVSSVGNNWGSIFQAIKLGPDRLLKGGRNWTIR